MLIDSHCHLDFPEFEEDFKEILKRADEAGVKIMQTIGTKLSSWGKVLNIAEQYPHIYASFGIHPNEILTEEFQTAEQIIEFTKHPKVIGIGETGLDYYYENSPRDLQIRSFREHIKASRITGLPIIIHTRAAEEDTINILEEEMRIGKFKGVIHCFTSTQELAEKSIELGLKISISGIITFKNSVPLQQIISKLPLESLLIETDAPYLAPTPHRGKRNEPAYVAKTAEFLAQLLDVTTEQLSDATSASFLEIFDKVKI